MTDLKRCVTCLLPETHETIQFDEHGVCNICRDQGVKQAIDWSSKLYQLDELVNSYSGKFSYDYMVPFSGGKDSTWTLYYLMQRYPKLRPLVVRFNHGFLRPRLNQNCTKVFKRLGVDVHEYTPSWDIVKQLMLQSFIEKGDFCWHCHTGIFAYPMQVAIRENVPLIFWGEPSAEYTAYYSYDNPEEVDEERFNRFINLGISADDMALRLHSKVSDRDLSPYRFPDLKQLQAINCRSVCLGSYIPWDVKKQVSIIKQELGWDEDEVENVPIQYGYEKIECWMQGVRDFIKYIKRGYTRPTHLSAIDLRNKRITLQEAKVLIQDYEGRRPPSLDLFLEYLGLSEDQFFSIAIYHSVSPWEFDQSKLKEGTKTHDFDYWKRGNGLDPNDTTKYLLDSYPECVSCIGCSK